MTWSEIIGLASALFSGFSAFFAWRSAKMAYKSIRQIDLHNEASLLTQLLDKYSDEKMYHALSTLGTIKNEISSPYIEAWAEKLKNNNIDAQKIEIARRTVKYYYRGVAKLYQEGMISRKTVKQVCSAGGATLFLKVVLPMESVINPHRHKAEFDPVPDVINELINEGFLNPNA
jgi:hypothetical protein